MPEIALSIPVVTRARSASALRNAGWCERSPVSAAVTAYCIGPGLHRRPSASFLMAASAGSRRGDDPTAIQPARQPGARYAFDKLEYEMIGASLSSAAIAGTVPSYPRSP